MYTGFSGLSSFIDQHRPELELAETRVSSTDTGAADHVGGAQDLLLALTKESLVLPLVVRAQFALLVLELNELL